MLSHWYYKGTAGLKYGAPSNDGSIYIQVKLIWISSFQQSLWRSRLMHRGLFINSLSLAWHKSVMWVILAEAYIIVDLPPLNNNALFITDYFCRIPGFLCRICHSKYWDGFNQLSAGLAKIWISERSASICPHIFHICFRDNILCYLFLHLPFSFTRETAQAKKRNQTTE